MPHQFHREIEQAMNTVFSTFGENEPVQIIKKGKPLVEIRGVYSETTKDVTNCGAIITSTAPNVTLWEKDLPGELDLSLRLKIRGECFSIKDTMRDGHGNIMLELFRE